MTFLRILSWSCSFPFQRILFNQLTLIMTFSFVVSRCFTNNASDVKSVQEHFKDLFLAKFFEESSFESYELHGAFITRVHMADLCSSLMVEFKKTIQGLEVFHEQPRVFGSQASQGTNYYLLMLGI